MNEISQEYNGHENRYFLHILMYVEEKRARAHARLVHSLERLSQFEVRARQNLTERKVGLVWEGGQERKRFHRGDSEGRTERE